MEMYHDIRKSISGSHKYVTKGEIFISSGLEYPFCRQIFFGLVEKLLGIQRYLINYGEEKKNIHKETISINAMDITPAMRMV